MALGYVLGHVQVFLLRPPARLKVHVVVLSMFGNLGNLPLVLVASLAVDAPDFFGPDADVFGTAYVGFGLWVYVLVLFSLGCNMMSRQAIRESMAEEKRAEDNEAMVAKTHETTKLDELSINGAKGMNAGMQAMLVADSSQTGWSTDLRIPVTVYVDDNEMVNFTPVALPKSVRLLQKEEWMRQKSQESAEGLDVP